MLPVNNIYQVCIYVCRVDSE